MCFHFFCESKSVFRRRGALVFVGILRRMAPEMVFACGTKLKTSVLVSEVVRLCRQNEYFVESFQNAMFRTAI